MPWWVRPSLGDTPASVTKKVPALLAQGGDAEAYHPWIFLAPRSLLHPLAAGAPLCSFSPSSPHPGPEGTSVSTAKGAVQKGEGESQHCRWERLLEWDWDAMLPTRDLKRQLSPWPDTLAGSGVSGVKNKPSGRRAGVGRCACLHCDVQLLAEQLTGEQRKPVGFGLNALCAVPK